MPARAAIDIGGTFTDFVLRGDDGVLVTEKRLTDYGDLVAGIRAGLERLLARAEVPASAVERLVHATTLGSNAVLERRGPRTALLTTKGFRDVLAIQRSLRWSMYDVQIEKVPPLVPPSQVREVDQRCRADGSVLRPLDEDAVRGLARELKAEGVQAVAVAYLHSYAAPDHERRTRELLLEEAPGLAVALSSEISLQAREYERTNTAIVNAYLMPVLGDYLARLENTLGSLGVEAPLWIMQSSGGLAPASQAAALPVRTIESGPAAGALMGADKGAEVGEPDVIAFDMGGTTAKVAVIAGGRPATTRYFELQRVDLRRGSGLPLDIPAIDLVEIGAGGGSVAEVHAGTLKVGPRSAGSTPGPACYGRGGTEPTVTDANLLLGYLDPDSFAGGELRLDREASERAVGDLASALGLDLARAAWGIHEIVNLEMERAISLVSIDRGLDPRDYAMVASGGAAPGHACRLARAVGIPRVIVPPAVGVGSALGLLEADESIDLARTALVQLDDPGAAEQAAAIFAQLEEEARRVVGGAWGADQISVRRTVGIRFSGQAAELEVTASDPLGDLSALREGFLELYERNYGYRELLPIEAVTWFLTVLRGRDAGVPSALEPSGPAEAPPTATRPAFFPEAGHLETAVIPREALRPGEVVAGPCLVEEAHTTTVVPPGDRLQADQSGGLVITIEGEHGA